jgi:hypothetical protein
MGGGIIPKTAAPHRWPKHCGMNGDDRLQSGDRIAAKNHLFMFIEGACGKNRHEISF